VNISDWLDEKETEGSGRREFPEYTHYEIISFPNRESQIKPRPDQYMDYFFYFTLMSHSSNLLVKVT
jgi:hypothetical protein